MYFMNICNKSMIELHLHHGPMRMILYRFVDMIKKLQLQKVRSRFDTKSSVNQQIQQN